MADNAEFVWEYDAKYFLSNFITEISTVCKLKTTDMKVHWSSLNDVEVTVNGTVVLSVFHSFVFIKPELIKFTRNLKTNGNWDTTAHFPTNLQPSNLTSKILYQEEKLFIIQKWNFTEIIRHSFHTQKLNLCHAGTSFKMSEKLREPY